MTILTQPTPTTDAPAVIYAVDPEHSGLRLVVLLGFVGIAVVVFLIANAIIGQAFALLPILISIGVAYPVSILVERTLKRTWKSGRSVQIDAEGVRLQKAGATEIAVLSEDPARIVFWRFVISKRARIPKGWSMFACAVQVDSTILPVYTFLPPTRADAFPRRELFKLLEPLKGRTRDDERPDLRLAGEQKRLRDAENVRWVSGGEMSPEDFAAFIDAIAARYPQWMPNP